MTAKRRRASPKSPLAAAGMRRGLRAKPGELDAGEIHQLRRSAKRTRAILHLGEQAGRAETRAVRHGLTEAVKPYGRLRDATVVSRVAANLARKLTDDAQDAARTLAVLPPPRPNRAWWRRRAAALERACAALEQVNHRNLTPAELAPALARSVRRVCKRARRSLKHPEDIGPAHEWRKSVLILRTQLEVTGSSASQGRAKLLDALKALGRELGHAVDLALVERAAERHAWRDAELAGVKKLVRLAKEKRRRWLERAHQRWPGTRRRLRRWT